MLFAAAILATSSPCGPSQIAAEAVVSPLSEKTPEAIDLSQVDDGFSRATVQQVRWSCRCAPEIKGLYGGSALITSSGLMLWTRGQPKLEVRDDKMLPADPEPQHPEWPGHRFVGSASLAAGTWRVGTWVRGDGRTEIARYRPNDPAAPVSLVTSAKPIVGLFYLGAPDTFGGTLFFAQRLGRSQFRMITMPWSEAHLRAVSR